MNAHEQSRTLRWLVLVALSLATATMFAVSMRANYLYGYSIGQTPETKVAIAWANVGADLWKGLGLIVVVALWRSRSRKAAAAVCLTWTVCLAFSVSSAIGVYLQERTALISGREAMHAFYEDAQSELAAIDARLKYLGPHRTVAQVEAAIVNVFARVVFTNDRVRGTVGVISNNCAKHDARTAVHCAELAGLREERATATEVDRLTTRAESLRQTVRTLRERGGSASPDSVGAFWSWATRNLLSVKDVGFGLPIFFALMIELVSSLGPLGIVTYAEVTRAGDVSRPAAVSHALSRRGATGRVVEYMSERTQPSGAIGLDELYVDYQAWCAARELTALSKAAFIDEFDRVREMPELLGKIRKFGMRYYGIGLAESAAG